jgi:hypothetical protein
MRKFSRHMPARVVAPLSLRARLVGGAILALLLSLLAYWLAVDPSARWVVGGLLVLLAALHLWQRHRLRRLHAERAGEDIGGFARAFPRGTADPWIIRATYEEVAEYTELAGRRCAVRPDDRLADLGIVDEDVCGLLLDVCTRARRRTEGWDTNPHLAGMETVRQVVLAAQHQPAME